MPCFLLLTCAYGEQDWVYTLDRQLELRLIWDGTNARPLGSVRKEFRRNRATLKDLYYYNGHLYRLDELYNTDPGLFVQYMSTDPRGRMIRLHNRMFPGPGESRDQGEGPASRNVSSQSRAGVGLTVSADPNRWRTAGQNPWRPVHPVTFEEYLLLMYHRGLENDLAKALILPDPNCPTCQGYGRVKCHICSGAATVSEIRVEPKTLLAQNLQTLIRLREEGAIVHDGGVSACNEFKRLLREDPRPDGPYHVVSAERYEGGGLRTTVITYEKVYPMFTHEQAAAYDAMNEAMERLYVIEERARAISRAIEQQSTIPSDESETTREKERRKEEHVFDCYPCVGHGWFACPDCVFTNPTYDESFKSTYLARFDKKARKSTRRKKSSEGAGTLVPNSKTAPK